MANEEPVMRLITASEVERTLKMDKCIPLMRRTLAQMAEHGEEQVLRSAVPLGEHSVMGLMPSVLASQGLLGVKILTIYHENYKRGLSSHQGVVAVFDRDTGGLRALVDAGAITAIRTAAVSAVATDVLARRDSGVLCLLGAGVQARSHLEAVRLVRNIKRVYVWDLSEDRANRFKADTEAGTGVSVEVCASPQIAARDADIICTVTSAKTPVLMKDWVRPGAHINAVGACGKDVRELDTALAAGSAFFVDSRISAMNEAGDLLIPIAQGVLDPSHIKAELGEVLCGKHPGRTGADEITVFEALGLAAEDVVAADFVASTIKEDG